ncbi:hypothetical protein C8R45DRAFT_936464 [Mycena sanguinolenta]|nr:hypothetical protein C8R45DRAFT_936464 [Mycena sanguinolenta]
MPWLPSATLHLLAILFVLLKLLIWEKWRLVWERVPASGQQAALLKAGSQLQWTTAVYQLLRELGNSRTWAAAVQKLDHRNIAGLAATGKRHAASKLSEHGNMVSRSLSLVIVRGIAGFLLLEMLSQRAHHKAPLIETMQYTAGGRPGPAITLRKALRDTISLKGASHPDLRATAFTSPCHLRHFASSLRCGKYRHFDGILWKFHKALSAHHGISAVPLKGAPTIRRYRTWVLGRTENQRPLPRNARSLGNNN